MDKAQIVRLMIFVTHQNSSEILQPGKQPLDLPSPLVAPQFPPVLRLRLLSVLLVWRNHLNTQRRQFLIQRIRFIGFVADRSFGLLLDKALNESFLHKVDFRRASRRRVDGDKKTSAVCQELRTLAPLGLSDFRPLFLQR